MRLTFVQPVAPSITSPGTTTCKRELFFISPKWITSPMWGPPLPCKQTLNDRRERMRWSALMKSLDVWINVLSSFTMKKYTRHLHISHNAPYLLPKILHDLCSLFLLGITAIPREIENNGYAKFWGANKVYYGRCANGKWRTECGE